MEEFDILIHISIQYTLSQNINASPLFLLSFFMIYLRNRDRDEMMRLKDVRLPIYNQKA